MIATRRNVLWTLATAPVVLALADPLGSQPGQHRCRCRDLRHQHGHARATAGRTKCRASIKAEPTHPKQRGTNHRKAQIIGREVF